MSQSTLSAGTFSGWFDATLDAQPKPDYGELSVDGDAVSFGDSTDTVVPLSKVKHVHPNRVPDELGPIPPGELPITMVYEHAGGEAQAVVAGDASNIGPLTAQLLEVVLTDEPVRVKHPARVQGAETPISFKRGTLKLTDGVIGFGTEFQDNLDTADLLSFEGPQANGGGQHLVSVTYAREGTQYRTVVQFQSERTASVFDRYLDTLVRLRATDT